MKYIKSVLSVLVLSTLLVAALPQKAYACSCLAQTTQEHYTNSELVFRGSITEFVGGKATFAVDEVFKGEAATTVRVTTPQDSAACGLNFSEFSDWVIFTNQEEGVTGYSANLCSGSFNFSNGYANMSAEETSIYTELKDLAVENGTYSADAPAANNTVIYILAGGLIGLIVIASAVYAFRSRKK